MTPQQKKKLKQLRRYRIRNKVSGTSDRPRMVAIAEQMTVAVWNYDDVTFREFDLRTARNLCIRFSLKHIMKQNEVTIVPRKCRRHFL